LNVSKQVIHSVYQQLLAEGYVESKPRSGIFILPFEQNFKFISGSSSSINNIEEVALSNISIDFFYSSLDSSKFPLRIWRKCMNRALENIINMTSYGDKQGELHLRKQISHYVRKSRGINCTSDQIFIFGGTQQSLHFVTRLLDLTSSKVAIENPGYEEARAAFVQSQCKICYIPLNEDGISVSHLKQSFAKAVYITASHQFPMGMVLPIKKRLELLEWAKRNKSYIIEDDYDSEFRYIGKPIPPLKSLDKENRVIYCGTFSKSFSPSIRCSYVILPENLVEQGILHLKSYSQGASPIIQDALAHFMEEGFFEKHIRRMKTTYQKKHKVLLQAIENHLSSYVEVIGEKAGLHVLLYLKNKKADDLIIQAEKLGVRIYSPIAHWYLQKPESIIMLGFGALSEQQIERGIQLLSSIIKHEAVSKGDGK
jgi:GntR family transcriptional regulator/MocR family aminotransferase